VIVRNDGGSSRMLWCCGGWACVFRWLGKGPKLFPGPPVVLAATTATNYASESGLQVLKRDGQPSGKVKSKPWPAKLSRDSGWQTGNERNALPPPQMIGTYLSYYVCMAPIEHTTSAYITALPVQMPSVPHRPCVNKRTPHSHPDTRKVTIPS
jgi:hypothetical protein